MKVLAGEGIRGPAASTALMFAALAALTVGTVSDLRLERAALLVIFAVAGFLSHHWLLRWDVLVGLLVVVILFIPIRRFVLPGDFGFQLEPYRLLVAVLFGAWGSSLLIDPRVRLRRTGLEAPLWLFVVAAFGSILVNLDYLKNGAQYVDPVTRIVSQGSLESNVVKALTFFASFVLVFYFIVSVVRQPRRVEGLIKLLVCCGGVVAVLSAVESRTGFNAFNQLPRVLPFLQENFVPEDLARGARLRAKGPAEHALALSAALAMLVPLGVYLAATTRRARWWLATAVLLVGTLAAVSRTGVVMLGVAALVFLWVRPRETKRLWPALIPAVVLVHFAVPGTLGTLKASFAPPGGLIAEQRVASVAGQPGGGRLADIAPSLGEWWERPLLGQGFGTRVTAYVPDTHQVPNAAILDNQWLATLLETGIVGAVTLAWLLVRLVRKLTREARRDQSQRGWLLGALAASVASLAVGMFVFDALSFVQVAFLLFILMGFGVVTLQAEKERT